MNQDKVKGTIEEILGSAKQTAGEMTGNMQLEAEGIAQKLKGKLEVAWGEAKDAVHEANQEARVKHESRIDVAIDCAAKDTEPR